MPVPEGKLHPGQYEVLRAIWEIGPPGATTLQVWEHISKSRSIVRTTILKVVDKLEERAWLRRKKIGGEWHYWPTAERSEVEAAVAEDFLGSFFAGSASELMVSLIGESKVSETEINRLKAVLDQAKQAKSKTKGKPKKKGTR
jgi:BlaI family penicillinase repressor